MAQKAGGSDQAAREALGGSSIFLKHALLKSLKRLCDQVYPEVPVSAAPFSFDPVEGAGASGSGRPAGPAAFRKAVAYSQNESMRRETVVDFVATQSRNVLCIAVKKPDPPQSWVFTRRSEDDVFSVLAKAMSDKNADDLMHVPKAHGGIDGLSLRMERWNHRRFSLPKYDQGLSISAHGAYCDHGESLADAARKIVEGTFGLATESLVRHVSSGQGDRQFFIPIIVTTAQILGCECDPDDLAEDGLTADGLSKTRLEQQGAAIYDCPVPASARFPDQIVDLDDGARTRQAVRWPVVVMNPGVFGDLLYRICTV